MKRAIILSSLALALTACSKPAPESKKEGEPKAVAPAAATQAEGEAAEKPAAEGETAKIGAVVENDEAKADEAKADEAKADEAKADETNTAQGAATEQAKPTEAAAGPGCAYQDAVAKAGEADKEDGAAPQAMGCGEYVAPAPIKVGETTHYGAEFAMAQDATMPVDDVIAKADEFNGKDVRISAKINKVCKKKGCWFVLQGDEQDGQFIRVTMAHQFFVPLDCEGKKAVVEGTFRKVDLPEAARKHLAEDGGEDPNAVKGKAMELTLVAKAVDIEG